MEEDLFVHLRAGVLAGLLAACVETVGTAIAARSTETEGEAGGGTETRTEKHSRLSPEVGVGVAGGQHADAEQAPKVNPEVGLADGRAGDSRCAERVLASEERFDLRCHLLEGRQYHHLQ